MRVQLLEKNNDQGEKEFAIATVFNAAVWMKIMKTFLSENEGSTTYKFNFENKILDSLGEKLFKTKIWNKWMNKFSLEAFEDPNKDKENWHSTILFNFIKEESKYEITTREFLIKR